MKGTGLEPIEKPEDKSSGEEVHVFGRNLQDRIVYMSDDVAPSASFVAPQSDAKSEDDDIESIRKRKFDAITGEENETTKFQGEFKLFIWDKTTSNWIEKGRGQLKLNDLLEDDKMSSRLIMRVNGTLKIILNVSIKKSHFKVIASSKTNVRFTDSQDVWAASGSNAQELKELIEERLSIQKLQANDTDDEKCHSEDRVEPLKKRRVSDQEDDDDDDDNNHTDESPARNESRTSSNEDGEQNPSSSASESTPTNHKNDESPNNVDTEEPSHQSKEDTSKTHEDARTDTSHESDSQNKSNEDCRKEETTDNADTTKSDTSESNKE